jgi:inhibitor of KinA sporulation pathway (predicted exonuclease)
MLGKERPHRKNLTKGKTSPRLTIFWKDLTKVDHILVRSATNGHDVSKDLTKVRKTSPRLTIFS